MSRSQPDRADVRPGTLFLVVGPSGAGKDTLIHGAREELGADSNFVFVQRTITRSANAGGEAHEEVTREAFAARKDSDGFYITWTAHGLDYGLPKRITADLAEGRNVIANVSRTIPALLAGRARVVVIEITVPPGVLAVRLSARGRENAADIGQRLARQGADYPWDMTVLRVINDATPDIGIARLIETLKETAGNA